MEKSWDLKFFYKTIKYIIMAKKIKTKEEFMKAIASIAKDGSVTLNLKSGISNVPKEKQYSYVDEADKMSLNEAIDNLPTALRFDLIKEGFEDLIDGLKFDEIDGPDDYWPGRMSSYILRKFPEHESKIDWNKLNNTWLVHVLIDQPQFTDKADFSKIDIRSSADLISKRPELSKHFDITKFNTPENAQHWYKILEKQPQFANQCDWSLISDYQKNKLKEIHPSIKF
jgi:hypothetical protein